MIVVFHLSPAIDMIVLQVEIIELYLHHHRIDLHRIEIIEKKIVVIIEKEITITIIGLQIEIITIIINLLKMSEIIVQSEIITVQPLNVNIALILHRIHEIEIDRQQILARKVDHLHFLWDHYLVLVI